MPFDSMTIDRDVAAFARFHDHPTMRGLAYALRHPELWPVGFHWDYSDCNQCAIGLAARLLDIDFHFLEDEFQWMRKTFRINSTTTDKIFDQLHEKIHVMRKDITPNHVADAIDRYLVRHPSK